jgi:hypothetical protein
VLAQRLALLEERLRRHEEATAEHDEIELEDLTRR